MAKMVAIIQGGYEKKALVVLGGNHRDGDDVWTEHTQKLEARAHSSPTLTNNQSLNAIQNRVTGLQ